MILASGAVLVCAVLSGCQLFGAVAENYKRESTHLVKAEYEGLGGKSFAVIVAADRALVGEHPGLVEHLTAKITERLSARDITPLASGFVPAQQVLRYQASNPAWGAKSPQDLASDLGGVDRVILIELGEYRLNEPGNAYEWSGVASGGVRVIEADGAYGDAYAFDKSVRVQFPDQKGVGPEQLGRVAVSSTLAKRFIDRVTWLMYDHQEPYYPDY